MSDDVAGNFFKTKILWSCTTGYVVQANPPYYEVMKRWRKIWGKNWDLFWMQQIARRSGLQIAPLLIGLANWKSCLNVFLLVGWMTREDLEGQTLFCHIVNYEGALITFTHWWGVWACKNPTQIFFQLYKNLLIMPTAEFITSDEADKFFKKSQEFFEK